MTLQVVERGRKHKIERDPAWIPGRHQATITVYDQHYLDGGGIWQDIDESLAVDGLNGFSHEATRMAHRLRVATTGTRRWYPRRNIDTEYVEFAQPQFWNGSVWANLPLGTPVISGNTVTWDRPNYSLKLATTWKHIKLEVMLKNSNAAARIRWAVSLTGLTWSNWSLIGQDSSVVGWIDKPIAWDALGSEVNPNITITPSFAGGFVEFNGNLAGAVYPVTIDPTFTDGPSGDVTTSNDTAVRSGTSVQTAKNFGVAVFLSQGTTEKGLLRFNLSSIAASATCNSATVSVFQYISGSALAFTLSFFSIAVGNTAWIEGTKNGVQALAGEPCWDALAADGAGGVTTAWAGSAGLATATTDYESPALGTVSGNKSDANGTEYAAALTASRVRGWFGGSNTNYGLLMTTSANLGGIASSDNATSTYRPKLVVDYTLVASLVPHKQPTLPMAMLAQ